MSVFKMRAEGILPPAVIDADEVRRGLAVLANHPHYVEIRGIIRKATSKGSRFHLAEELEDLVISAAQMSAGTVAVWFVYNPVGEPPDTGGSCDEHVVARRWIFIDIDSRRSRGFDKKDTNASDEEKQAARLVASAILEYLSDRGWPSPVMVDSGNGWHLYYRIDLPNDEPSRELVSSFLYALANRFNSENGTVGKECSNASRCAKLPGTYARKGPHTPDRPHRLVKLIHAPTHVLGVERDQVQAIIDENKKTAPSKKSSSSPPPAERPQSPFRLRDLTGSSAAGAWAHTALDREEASVRLSLSPTQGGDGRNNALNKAAFSLGQIVAGGGLSESLVRSRLSSAASAAGLDDREIESTLDSGLRAGMARPRTAPDRNGTHHANGVPATAGPLPNKNAPTPDDKPRWKFTLDGETLANGELKDFLDVPKDDEGKKQARIFEMFSFGNLMATHFPEPNWIVPGIMSEGLNILAGAPKQGKSVLALNLALTVAGGGKALGNIQLAPSNVFYLSLEDKQRRIKERAVKMLRALDPSLAESINKRLTVVTDWPRQDDMGLELIDQFWRRRVEKPGLLIIDVWNRFCSQRAAGGNAYEQDSDYLGEVKKYVDRHGFTALIIHHTRKPSGTKDSSDYVQEVSGTMGLTGVADGIMVLMRQREEKQASLHITGRDVHEIELVLDFDPLTLTWKSLGTQSEHITGEVQKSVLAYLEKMAPKALFISDIASEVHQKEDSVRKALKALRDRHLIRQCGHAWAFPGEGDRSDEDRF